MAMKKSRKAAVSALCLVAAVLGGCSSTGGAPRSEGGGDTAGGVDTPRYVVAMVTHGAPGDTYWDLVRKGAEDAAKKDNIELRYSSDPQAPNQANFIRSAVDAGVDGIAVTMPNAEAIGPAAQNAVDHGIEPADKRRAAGKSEVGNIRLSLGREGGDILLVLADDGGGIRLDAVKRKAIERGLMDEGSDLSDHEILQFILEAGFSTAEKVTQISGRGVGMDVVKKNIQSLNGQIEIFSEAGRGTRVTIRLPLTLAILPTLLIQSADDPFVFRHSVPEPAELSASTTLELHRRGGHVGFVEGTPRRPRYYLERRIPEWLCALS